MPRSFSRSTAELTIQVAEAVYVNRKCIQQFVVDFCDLSNDQAQTALELAVDIGLIKKDGANYFPDTPLIRFICTPDESKKAALLRILLESYEPFVVFRERLNSTSSVDTSAQQTKTILKLDAHREEIKDTLISLGTYANAISSLGGGRYIPSNKKMTSQLSDIVATCDDLASSEACIRTEIGDYSDKLDRSEVIHPLANALLKARSSQSAEAVTEAAKAIESYLVRLADRMNVNISGATGINSKLDKFRTNNSLPKKLVESGKYLGQIRNAADHGVDIDPDVGAVWHILESTGVQYVFVACSFIRSCGAREFLISFF